MLKRKTEVVAKAIKDSLPGLVHPEAWPWVTMAEAAIKAIEQFDEDTDNRREQRSLYGT